MFWVRMGLRGLRGVARGLPDGGAGEGSKRASVHGQILASQFLQPVGGCEEIQKIGRGGDKEGVGFDLGSLADACAVEIGDCKPIGPINKVTGTFGFYVPRPWRMLAGGTQLAPPSIAAALR